MLDAATLECETGRVLRPASESPDGDGWHGNALLVRPGAVAAKCVRRVALPGAEPRGAVVADFAPEPGGHVLRVVAAPLGLLRRCRARQAAATPKAVPDGGRDTHPALLLGDLDERRPPPGRRSSLRTFAPAFGAPPAGPVTFPSRRPVLAGDRILARPRGLAGAVEAHDSPVARVAFDHPPPKARLDLGILAAMHPTAMASAAEDRSSSVMA